MPGGQGWNFWDYSIGPKLFERTKYYLDPGLLYSEPAASVRAEAIFVY